MTYSYTHQWQGWLANWSDDSRIRNEIVVHTNDEVGSVGKETTANSWLPFRCWWKKIRQGEESNEPWSSTPSNRQSDSIIPHQKRCYSKRKCTTCRYSIKRLKKKAIIIVVYQQQWIKFGHVDCFRCFLSWNSKEHPADRLQIRWAEIDE